MNFLGTHVGLLDVIPIHWIPHFYPHAKLDCDRGDVEEKAGCSRSYLVTTRLPGWVPSLGGVPLHLPPTECASSFLRQMLFFLHYNASDDVCDDEFSSEKV